MGGRVWPTAMAEPTQTSHPPVTARATFLLLAKLALRLKPEERGKAASEVATRLADVAGEMPLTPGELADAYAALGVGSTGEAKPMQARRKEMLDLAEVLVLSLGKGHKAAGSRPPTANAIKVWDKIAKMGADPMNATRELVELTGRAALAVVGRGPIKVQHAGHDALTGFLSTLEPSGKDIITISAVYGVNGGPYRLPVPLSVPKQAALHKVAQPWASIGLLLGDVGHGHPQPSEEDMPPKAASKPEVDRKFTGADQAVAKPAKDPVKP